MVKKKKCIWISWEKHRRTQNIVDELGIQLFVFESNKTRWFKHPLFIFKTVCTITKEKPDILFVQNPSIILTLFAIFLKKIYKYEIVVDSHNAGLYPFDEKFKRLLFIYDYIQKKADLTIVTNSQLSDLVQKNCGIPFVLPDKIPIFKCPKKKIKLREGYNVVFICTFAKDEPYEEVISASEKLPSDYHIYITGNYKFLRDLKTKNNISYTGFLSETDYVNLVYSADAIIDLTSMQDALLCGAYESVALYVPLITTDTKVLKEYFHKGVIYTLNDSESIAKAIVKSKVCQKQLRKEVIELNKELKKKWNINFKKLKDILSL